MRALDLFSGIGGWSIGLHRHGITTVAACEIDAWKRSHYARRFPAVKLYDDVCALTAEVLERDGLLSTDRPIDIVVGSPPCTDISTANTSGLGVDGPESRLYFEAVRLVSEIRPRWCAFENSANLRSRGADRVLAEMEAAGYAVWPLVVGAAHAGAPHRRLRSWLVGCRVELLDAGSHAHGFGRRAGSQQAVANRAQPSGGDSSLPGPDTDTPGLRLEQGWRSRPDGRAEAEPALAAAHANIEGQHPRAKHVEVVRRRGDARHAVADRSGGGGNNADSDSAGQPLGQVLAGYDAGSLKAVERGFGLGWSDGPGALARSLRGLDGVSARLAGARTRAERIAVTSQLNRARSAYGDAVAIPVVEAVIAAIVEADASSLNENGTGR